MPRIPNIRGDFGFGTSEKRSDSEGGLRWLIRMMKSQIEDSDSTLQKAWPPVEQRGNLERRLRTPLAFKVKCQRRSFGLKSPISPRLIFFGSAIVRFQCLCYNMRIFKPRKGAYLMATKKTAKPAKKPTAKKTAAKKVVKKSKAKT